MIKNKYINHGPDKKQYNVKLSHRENCQYYTTLDNHIIYTQ